MWGQIIGAVAGGLLANKGARDDSAAIDEANKKNNQYYDAAFPYVTGGMSGLKSAYDEMIARGPFDKDYYVGPSEEQIAANRALYGMGGDNMSRGENIMNTTGGFAGNATDLYNQFASAANRPDTMAVATQYATDNMNPIVDAMMRDSTRQLNEQTLPGINMAASGSGNVNSSRAGVADALAQRAYDDRRADVRSDVFNSLRDASLNQSNNEFTQKMNALNNASGVNTGMADMFRLGNNMAVSGGNMSLGAADNLNAYDQRMRDAEREKYNVDNTFGFGAASDYLGAVSPVASIRGNYAPNMVNPTAATLGGMSSGWGAGGSLVDSIIGPMQGPPMPSSGGGLFGGGGFNPFSFFV